jgi:hypothetical protein
MTSYDLNVSSSGAKLAKDGATVYDDTTAPPDPPSGGISPDGTTLLPGAPGKLVTADGDWTFGAGGDTGLANHDVLLNGAGVHGARGTKMQVDKGSQLFLQNSLGSWYVQPGGGAAFVPASDPNAGGGNGGTGGGANTATLPSGEVIQLPGAATVSGITTSNDVDMRGRPAGWMVKDVILNGGGILADSPGFIVGCTWNNTRSKYPLGSAFAWNNNGPAHDIAIINGIMNSVDGQNLGCYGWIDKMRILCCEFHNPRQVWSMSLSQGNNSAGNNIEWGWCVITGEQRGGLETGGDTTDTSGVGQVFTNLWVHHLWCADLGPQETNAIGPISFVARGQKNTRIEDSFFRKGSAYGSGWSQAIETSVRSGQGTPVIVRRNLFVDFADYCTDNGLKSTFEGNQIFNCTQALQAGVTALSARPADPAKPAKAVIA